MLSGAVLNFHHRTHPPLSILLSDELAFLISKEDPFAPHRCIADALDFSKYIVFAAYLIIQMIPEAYIFVIQSYNQNPQSAFTLSSKVEKIECFKVCL